MTSHNFNLFTSQLGDTADPESRSRGKMTMPRSSAATVNPQIALWKQRQKELQKSTTRPYTVAGPTLTPIEKQFQQMTLARDWDGLFNFLPPKYWGQYGILGKYSFVDSAGKRTFVPFTESELQSFVFSPYYTVQPGHDCTDEQRTMGVAALLKAGNTHKGKFPASDWRHIWPIYPGWGYPGQRYGCEKYVPSTWVKIRKPVIAAAAIVSAVYLGPLVVGKIKALSAGGAATSGVATGGSGAASGIIGAGAKAGSIAAGGIASSGIATSGIATSGILAGSQKLIGAVNQGRTIRAIVRGEIPPPPIGISGSSWRDWTLNVARDEFEKDFKRKMTRDEERAMQAEIAAMQRELETTIPQNYRARPAGGLSPVVKHVQQIEEQRESDFQKLLLPAALVVGALVLGG